MIESGASKSFAEGTAAASGCSHRAPSRCGDAISVTGADASTERGGYSIFTWLNLVCLDAPLVAVSWLWLFAHQLRIPIAGGAALFLTAWLIYLADRFSDTLSLGRDAPVSLRQDFCRRHRAVWISAIMVVGLAHVIVIAQLDPRTQRIGLVVGALAFLYFLVNQLRPAVWQRWPCKEISIGFLFAAGVIVPIGSGLTSAKAWPIVFFATLCAMNCICIAFWERGLDLAQTRVSIATEFPRLARGVLPTLAFLAAVSLFVIGPVAISATLLALVHLFRDRIEPNTRTALADLVLLTPLLFQGAHA